MAYLRLGAIRQARSGKKSAGLLRGIDYIYNPEKTESKYVSGYNLSLPEDLTDASRLTKQVYRQMMDIKEAFGKEWGVQGYHYKLAFPASDHLTPDLCMQITKEFIERCLPEYQVAYSVHTNTEHLHSHIVFNSIDLIEGRKYRYENGDWRRYLMPVINELCEKYQLSRFNLEVEDEKTYKYKYDYSKRVKQTGTYTNDMILRDVDECISKADSYEKFKILMQEKGHLINDDPKHKYITILAPGRKKAARLVNLTPDKQTYTKANLMKMIAGTFQQDNRQEYMHRLFTDMGDYYKYVAASGIRLFDVKSFISKNGLQDQKKLDQYMDYLQVAETELSNMKKRIHISYEARYIALDNLTELSKLYPYYKSYKADNQKYKAEHDRAIEIYYDLKDHGYNLVSLYRFGKLADRCLNTIQDYKKHLYIEKQICQRMQQKLKQEEKTKKAKKTVTRKSL